MAKKILCSLARQAADYQRVSRDGRRPFVHIKSSCPHEDPIVRHAADMYRWAFIVEQRVD